MQSSLRQPHSPGLMLLQSPYVPPPSATINNPSQHSPSLPVDVDLTLSPHTPTSMSPMSTTASRSATTRDNSKMSEARKRRLSDNSPASSPDSTPAWKNKRRKPDSNQQKLDKPIKVSFSMSDERARLVCLINLIETLHKEDRSKMLSDMVPCICKKKRGMPYWTKEDPDDCTKPAPAWWPTEEIRYSGPHHLKIGGKLN